MDGFGGDFTLDDVQRRIFVAWPSTRRYRVGVTPSLIGAGVGFVLFGISLAQFIHIFNLMNERAANYTRMWWVFMILFWINLGDTLLKFIAISAYMEAAALEGIGFFLERIPTSNVAISAFQGTITSFVHFLYIYRIFRLTRNMTLFDSFRLPAKVLTYGALVAAGALSLASFSGFIYFAYILRVEPIITLFPRLYVPSGIALGGSALADVILTLCLVYHLMQHRSKAPTGKTSSIATRFIRLAFSTGFAPTALQVCELLLLVIIPLQGYWVGFGYLMSKIYIVAALALYEDALTQQNPHQHQSHTSVSSSTHHKPNWRPHLRDQISVSTEVTLHDDVASIRQGSSHVHLSDYSLRNDVDDIYEKSPTPPPQTRAFRPLPPEPKY